MFSLYRYSHSRQSSIERSPSRNRDLFWLAVQAITIWLGLTSLSLTNRARAQFVESFDSSKPSWELREADCTVPESQWNQKRVTDVGSTNRVERITFENGSGTQILVAHPIPPAYLIGELNPSVRIKADRGGIRMMVRVVFPQTASPEGSGPLKTLIAGPSYQSINQWQQLSFQNDAKGLTERLQEEIWLLRRKHSVDIDSSQAFVDMVVLNLYTGPGKSSVFIDDLAVDGLVDASVIADQARERFNPMIRNGSGVKTVGSVVPFESNVVAASYQDPVVAQPSDKRPSLVVRDGTVLLVNERPFLPRVIQHRGESFQFLKALGFNVVELTNTARLDQLEQARELDLWIVCPPPASVGLTPIEFAYDRVLAWSLGTSLTGRNLQNVEQKIREIRHSDRRQDRPVVAHVATHWKQFAQVADILSVGMEPLGTSFLASQYSEWVNQRSQTVEHNKPVWVDIQTDYPTEMVNQIRSMAATVPPMPVEPQQLQFLVYEAITGGGRGLRFLSRSRLDAPDPVTRLRAMSLEWLNTHLNRLEPWIAGGALKGKLTTENRQLEIHVFATNRSRLMLIQRPTHHEQILTGDVPLSTIQFRDPENLFSDRAMLISEIGLQPLTINHGVGGNEIVLEDCPFAAAVVMTDDPLVISRLNQTYQRIGLASSYQLLQDISGQWLSITQLIENQLGLMGRSNITIQEILTQAESSFQRASQFSENNSLPTALPALQDAIYRLAMVRRELIQEPMEMFQSKMSTPLLTHVSLVPLHWELATRLQGQRWNPNSLPAGDFESLDHLTRSGWENRRLDDERVQTTVILSDSDRVDGLYALRLAAKSTVSTSVIDAVPLWISTPPITVKGGQLVRIHGWVKIPSVIRGNMDGLMITDSLSGDAMAERIPVTTDWQEFTLYRGVSSDGQLKVTFSLTGLGEVLLDEVTIRTVDLPSPSRQAMNDRP